MTDSFNMDTFPCMDDVMEGFLDNVDLNQLDVELGDLTNTILENPMEYVDGISDSDSGISVAVEKNGCVTPGVASGDAGDCLKEHSPFSLRAQSDCVLTDAVGPVTDAARSSHGDPLLKKSGFSNASSESVTHFKNPVRIIKLAYGSNEQSTKIQVNNSQPVALRKVLPIQPINGVHGSVAAGAASKPLLKGVIKLLPQSHSTHINVSRPQESHNNTMPSIKKITDSQILRSSSFDTSDVATIPDAAEIGAFLDDYDPLTYSDASLEQHLLQNTKGDILRHFQTSLNSSQTLDHSGLSPSSPSYLGSCDTFGTGDCILTRAHLERIRKKQERMIKNRHAASMSRLRKKEYLERLEMRYEQLKRENHHLWRQNEEWRVRCLQLEQALNNVQSQLTDCANVPESQDPWNKSDRPDSCSPSKPGTLVKSSSPVLDVKRERLSPGQSVSTVSPVRTVAVTYPPSPATTLSSTFVRSAPRTSLCALYSKNSTSSSNEMATKCFSIESTAQPQSERTPNHRKTVLNNVVYPGKTSLSTPVAQQHQQQQSVARSNLISLGGIISRHRASHLPTSRSKLIATTSLLTMVCLFSLNLLTLPLNPVAFMGTSTGSELTSAASARISAAAAAAAGVKRWDAPRTHHFGDRILLNVRSSDDEQQWDSTEGATNKCLGLDCDQGQPEAFNANQTRLDEPVEMLLGWIEEHELSKVGAPFQNRRQKHPQRGYGPEPSKSRVPLTNIQTAPNFGPSNGSRRLNVINVNLPSRSSSPVTRTDSTSENDDNNGKHETSGTSNPHSASSPLARKSWPTFDPIRAPEPIVNRPSFTAVSERGIQPFHPQLWDPDDLVTAAGRQNGTVYVILTHLDHVQFHPVNPTNRNTTRKITFIVPAHPLETTTHANHKPLGVDARISMLQVDCELLNVSLIHPLRATAPTSPEGA